jgi:hypothetical protein
MVTFLFLYFLVYGNIFNLVECYIGYAKKWLHKYRKNIENYCIYPSHTQQTNHITMTTKTNNIVTFYVEYETADNPYDEKYQYVFNFTTSERKGDNYDKCQFCDKNAIGNGFSDRYNKYVFFLDGCEKYDQNCDDFQEKYGKRITICDPCSDIIDRWIPYAFYVCDGKRYKHDHSYRMND